jgi:hypothetical protein
MCSALAGGGRLEAALVLGHVELDLSLNLVAVLAVVGDGGSDELDRNPQVPSRFLD